ncbi:hypothetical protein HW555_012890, partial [Spodoptera exigua]
LTKHSRATKILALIPNEHAQSDVSGKSDSDDEIPNSIPSSNSSLHENKTSPTPSVDSSLVRAVFHEDNSDEDAIDTTPVVLTSNSPLKNIEDQGDRNFNNSNDITIYSHPKVHKPITIIFPLFHRYFHLIPIHRLQHQLPDEENRKKASKAKRKKPNIVVSSTKTPKKAKRFCIDYNWKRSMIFAHTATIEEHDNYINIPEPEHASPLAYFHKFFSPDILDDIVEQTNLYSTQNTGKSIKLTKNELAKFLAIHIIMGIVCMPSYLDYWSTKLRYNLVADLMPLKRYQQIRSSLHFVDNLMDDGDRYYKVRPVVEKVRQNCLAQDNGNRYSIDEMMIPYKGGKSGKRKQYMKDKPTKWGFKNFTRASVNGMIRDFVIYGGEDTFRFHKFTDKEASLGFGAQIVLALCQSIKRKPAIIFCDNFFTSPELLNVLREEYGIFGLGTIRGNRLRGAEKILPDDKSFKKQRRGKCAQVVCDRSKLAVVKWNDNKPVTLLSSYVGVEPMEKIKRYSKEEKGKVDVDCPQIVKEYNKQKGGVDLADMLVALCRIPMKTRRWYMGIFVQLVDISINNAWLMYRQTRKISLKQFRRELYDDLISLGKSENRSHDAKSKALAMGATTNPTKPRPPDEVKFDEVGHFPQFGELGRCRLCQLKTTVLCIKCKLRLCFVSGKTPRNCFLTFHTK